MDFVLWDFLFWVNQGEEGIRRIQFVDSEEETWCCFGEIGNQRQKSFAGSWADFCDDLTQVC